jgi:hypothetical protein
MNMNDWRKRRRSAFGLPHPNSPAGRIFDWSSSGIPHPNSPAGQNSPIPWKMMLLNLAPNPTAPELATPTPSTRAMISTTFTGLAVSQVFGVEETSWPFLGSGSTPFRGLFFPSTKLLTQWRTLELRTSISNFQRYFPP